MGVAARYAAGELVPVATDTLNYAVDESKDSVRDLVSAVHQGVGNEAAQEITPPPPAAVVPPKPVVEKPVIETKSSESVEDRLKKLKLLLNQGLIDEDDYQAQQERILADL